MECSVFMPFSPVRVENLLPYAALTQWSRAVRLWQGQSTATDPHITFAAAAGAGFRVPCGTGVTLMAQRHPMEAALQARTVAMATGHRFIAGIGPGAPVFQRMVLREPYSHVLSAVREYAVTMRTLLDGGVPGEMETVRCDAPIGAIPSPGVDVGLGVLRSGMARLAGEVADVAITWLCPPAYIRDVIRPALALGAERSGRPIPRIVAVVPFALQTPDKPHRDPTALVMAGNSAHLSQPHYRDMLHRAGAPVAGSPEEYVPALLETGAFVFDTEGDVAKRLLEYQEAGVDEVAINTAGVTSLEGPHAGLREVELIMDLLP